jgi:hypothetical protein
MPHYHGDYEKALTADVEQERQEMFKWLSTVKYKEHHKTIGLDFLPNSGRWLLQKADFIKWRKDSYSSILWLHGIRKNSPLSEIEARN